MRLVIDIETDAIVDPQVIWVAVCKDIDTGKEYVFERPDIEPSKLLNLLSSCTLLVGHNIIGYDYVQLKRLVKGFDFDPLKVIDTLILSRMVDFNLPGGHSLASWGDRFKYKKIKYNDFDNYNPSMLAYCKRDVAITEKIFKLLEERLINREEFKEAIKVEHMMQFICYDMHRNGFRFDYEKAQRLHNEIQEQLAVLGTELKGVFTPKTKFIREGTVKKTRHGTVSKVGLSWYQSNDYSVFTPGATYSLFEYVPFNPSSPKQVVERLNECGWKPTEKTKGHVAAEKSDDQERIDYFREYGWRVNEANLATLPEDAPEAAQKLIQWLLLDSRRSTLEEWFRAYKAPSKAIHGTFTSIGAWTQRMSHSKPNMGNIPSKDSKYNSPELKELAKYYGIEMRSLWTCDKDKEWLIGTDAKGIQLRIFAHYINDDEFTKALISGSEEEGSDAHSLNADALGLGCTRARAKTYIYAFLLGAGIAKQAQILGCSINDARLSQKNFLRRYPGLEYLKREVIPRDAQRGFFEGFDGRLVPCDSEHLMLAGYLQNGEACIMKHANVLWRKKLLELGIPFKQRNFVHDEWQTTTTGDKSIAETIGQIQSDSIRYIGERFKLNCPMEGNYKIGKNWNETH